MVDKDIQKNKYFRQNFVEFDIPFHGGWGGRNLK